MSTPRLFLCCYYSDSNVIVTCSGSEFVHTIYVKVCNKKEIFDQFSFSWTFKFTINLMLFWINVVSILVMMECLSRAHGDCTVAQLWYGGVR